MKIAITQRVIEFRNGPYDSIDFGFYDMFSGHTLLPIPNHLEHYRTQTIVDSDLVVFTGGNSMFPGNWQYENRLRVEKHTLDLAKLYNKPTLGISRGYAITVDGCTRRHFRKNGRYTHNLGVNCYNGSKVEVHSRHEEVLATIIYRRNVFSNR